MTGSCRRNHLEKLHAQGKTRQEIEAALEGLPVVSHTSVMNEGRCLAMMEASEIGES